MVGYIVYAYYVALDVNVFPVGYTQNSIRAFPLFDLVWGTQSLLKQVIKHHFNATQIRT